MAGKLTHLDAAGAAHMVDVTRKERTARTAKAEGVVNAGKDVIRAIRDASVSKGDVLAAARIAGIAAVKRTGDLIPLCHPLSITHARLDVELSEEAVRIVCTVKAEDCTGVEMEALTGAAVACLTVYDMTKSMGKGMEIGPIRLLEKQGGRSGRWERP